MDPYAIRIALANQIRDYVSTDINVYPTPHRNPDNPSITVRAGGEYIAYIGTFGADGIGDMMLDLVVATVATDDLSEFKLMSELLSVGSGYQSSIFDAVHSDRTLGGVVSDCVVLTAVDPIEGDPERASSVTLPVRIIFAKSGANV